jgi:hypothetical protein
MKGILCPAFCAIEKEEKLFFEKENYGHQKRVEKISVFLII